MSNEDSASNRFRLNSFSVDASQNKSQASQAAADAVEDLLSKRTGSLSICTTSSGSSDIREPSAVSSFQSKGGYAWDSVTQWLDSGAVTATAMSSSSSSAGILQPLPLKSMQDNKMEGSSKTAANVVRGGMEPKNSTAFQAGMDYPHFEDSMGNASGASNNGLRKFIFIYHLVSEKRTTFMIRNIPNKYTQVRMIPVSNQS